MSQTFNCPNCNAPLDIPANVGTTVRCPYCESSVVVPEDLRSERPRPTSFSLEGMQVENLRKAEQQEQLEEIIARLRAGDKIGAIKAWREAFDTSLKVSKEAVEALERGETVDLQALQSRAASSAVATRVATGGAASYGAGLSPAARRKAAYAAGGGTGCFVVGLIAFILFVTLVPMFFAFTSPGGPLAEPWARVNPFGKTRLELSFGGEGTGVGVFEDARHVAVDNNGHIFVGEYSGGRIQVFDESGKFITQWLARGEDVNDDDVYMVGMAADRNGVVYAAVRGDLFRYDGLTGEMLGQVLPPGENDYCDWVTVAPDNSLVTVWSWGNDDIARYDRNLNPNLVIPNAVSSVDDDDEVEVVAVDGAGTIYALGTWESSVYIFSADGRYVNRFGSEGDDEGQFTSPYVLAVDNQSRIYVSDFGGLLVFASDGRYLDTIPVEGFVYGITFDDQNRLYVVTSHEKVLRYMAPDLP